MGLRSIEKLVLESGIGNGRVTKLHSQMYELPSYQLSVVVGLLLSDGWLSFAKTKTNARFGFSQSFDKFEYF
jgi:hypothetical protein